MNIAIIFAGGTGERLKTGGYSIPKQFLEINGKPILIHTLEHFQNHKNIDKIYISVLADYISHTQELVKEYNITKVKKIINGGNTAMDSIYKALIEAKQENPPDSIVLIHDGVRPVINQEVIDNNIEGVKKFSNAITAIPCTETIVISQDEKTASFVPLRKETFKAQAPQSFILEKIISLHENFRKQEKDYKNIVDNCTLCQISKEKIHLVMGNFGNIKITTPEDVYVLKGILEYIKDKQK